MKFATHRPFLAGGGIALLAVLAYLPTLRAGFVWDDIHIYILNNPLLRQADGVLRFWFAAATPDYYPLAYTTFWIEWRVWGDHPAGYHAVNIVLHAITCVLLWRVLRRLDVPGAWAAAAVFAVHPVTVETVAWISQRKALLATVFGFGTLLCYFKHDTTGRRSAYAASLALFFLSLSGKPSLITLPIILLGYGWFKRRRIGRADVLRTLPFFAVAFVMGVIGTWFQSERVIGAEVIRDETALERLAGAGYAVWFYAYKALLPLNLSFVYPRWALDASNGFDFLPLVALAVCFAVLWKFRRTWGRPVLAGFGCFVITLVPALGFVDVYFWRFSLVGDHYQYQSLPALIALVVGGAAYIVKRKHAPPPAALIPIGTALWIGLAALTWRQCGAYENEETLWTDTLQKNPTAWLAHNNLGTLRIAQNRLEDAIRHFNKAVELNPRFAAAYTNIGLVHAQQGNLLDAVLNYSKAIELNPRDAAAHNNLGAAFINIGKFPEAEEYLAEAVRLKPLYANAHHNLGLALAGQHCYYDAIESFRAALRIDPAFSKAQTELDAASAELRKEK
ncbi:MAG: tetratricopeptide repeat protein [Phycisphaerae bacterium]